MALDKKDIADTLWYPYYSGLRLYHRKIIFNFYPFELR